MPLLDDLIAKGKQLSAPNPEVSPEQLLSQEPVPTGLPEQEIAAESFDAPQPMEMSIGDQWLSTIQPYEPTTFEVIKHGLLSMPGATASVGNWLGALTGLHPELGYYASEAALQNAMGEGGSLSDRDVYTFPIGKEFGLYLAGTNKKLSEAENMDIRNALIYRDSQRRINETFPALHQTGIIEESSPFLHGAAQVASVILQDPELLPAVFGRPLQAAVVGAADAATYSYTQEGEVNPYLVGGVALGAGALGMMFGRQADIVADAMSAVGVDKTSTGKLRGMVKQYGADRWLKPDEAAGISKTMRTMLDQIEKNAHLQIPKDPTKLTPKEPLIDIPEIFVPKNAGELAVDSSAMVPGIQQVKAKKIIDITKALREDLNITDFSREFKPNGIKYFRTVPQDNLLVDPVVAMKARVYNKAGKVIDGKPKERAANAFLNAVEEAHLLARATLPESTSPQLVRRKALQILAKDSGEEVTEDLIKQAEKITGRSMYGAVGSRGKAKELLLEAATKKAKLRTEKLSNLGGIGKGIQGGIDFIDDYIRPSRSVLNRISPKLGAWLGRYEAKSHIRAEDYITEANNTFFTTLKTLDDEMQRKIGLALSNADEKALRALFKQTAAEKQLTAGYALMRDTLDKLGEELADYHKDFKFITGYFPRWLEDLEGFEKLKGVADLDGIDAIKKTYMSNRGLTKLTPEDEIHVINMFMRNRGGIKIDTTTPGSVKKRIVQKLDDKEYAFYAKPQQAYESYIRAMVDDIEQRKFFGREISRTTDNLQDSIGKKLDELKLTGPEVNKVKQILFARFGKGQQAPSSVIQTLKNVGYMGTLGHPFSALTQLGDLGLAAYSVGLRDVLPTIAERLLLKTPQVNAIELGLMQASQEFVSNERNLRKGLDFVLKTSGFQKVDRLGKETIINASLRKAKRLAKKNPDQLYKKYANYFEQDMHKVVDDLANNRITDDVKALLFHEVAELQPVTLSEMPLKYLEVPSGRLLYALRSFTIKQFDRIRIDTIEKFAEGKFVEGGKNLFSYLVLGVGTNMSVDMLKDHFKRSGPEFWNTDYDNDKDMGDYFVHNLVKFFGTSDYALAKLTGEIYGQNKASVAWEHISAAPPGLQMGMSFMEDMYMVATSNDIDFNDYKSGRYIPWAGMFYHYWYGPGLKGLK